MAVVVSAFRASEHSIPKKRTVFPVVLCGGAGTRLWPLSRRLYPKQFCDFMDEGSLFAQTVTRGRGDLFSEKMILVANQSHRSLIEREMLSEEVSDYTLILEPVGRNTTPAITLAALTALRQDPESLILVMPSDQLIPDTTYFSEVVERGIADAEKGFFVTFGITPTAPETGYGYIECDPKEDDEARSVRRFVEKPNKTAAEVYLKEKNFYWNSGIFLFKAAAFLESVRTLQPEIFDLCEKSLKIDETPRIAHVDARVFEKCPAISVDYGIMEKYDRTKMVPFSKAWSDLGSWQAIWEASPKNTHGNALLGDVIAEETSNSYVRSDHRSVAVVGVDNIVVVENADAVLVTTRDRAQDVKKIVERLQQDQRSLVDSHVFEKRPWGEFRSLDRGDRHQVKRITVKPGHKLSLQMHHHRAEHWIVVAGTAKVTRGDEETLLVENQSIYLPTGIVHSLENPGRIDLELIEIQVGAYLGEDDIVRLSDVYGRT